MCVEVLGEQGCKQMQREMAPTCGGEKRDWWTWRDVQCTHTSFFYTFAFLLHFGKFSTFKNHDFEFFMGKK